VEALLIPLVVGLALAGAYYGDRKCRQHLESWATENGYVLLSATRSWFSFRFFFRSDDQRVYEILLRDAAGGERVAWARVGGYFLGSWSDQVDVRWD
jgi:hypothetical protein